MREAAIAGIALLLVGCGEARKPKQDFAFAAASIRLPAVEPQLPGGAAGELVTNSCTACHSTEMILAQPPLKPETWKAEVEKMRKVYHADIAPADDAKLVDALVTLQKGTR